MSLNLKSLIGKLDEATRSALEAAAGLCVSRTHYDIEVDDEELWEGNTDAGGTLMVPLPPETQAGVRIRKRTE